MGEDYYYNIGEKLKISIENLYKHNSHILGQIEEGLKDKTKEDPVVGYQGVAGSFGEEAASTYFRENASRLVAHEAFEDVFEALHQKAIDYGVVPIENSSAGEVLEIYDLIQKHNLYIVGEQIIKAEHNLLGIPGAQIKDLREVYSHPQALSQSRDFLKAHNYIEEKAYVNTATASKFVAKLQDKSKALP